MKKLSHILINIPTAVELYFVIIVGLVSIFK
jgi:hypothetical protein